MIVLDTHALIWWVNGDSLLSIQAKVTIDGEQSSPEGVILLSTISAWEIAMLIEKGRLALTMSVDDWLNGVGEIEGVRFVPVDVRTGIEATRYPVSFTKTRPTG